MSARSKCVDCNVDTTKIGEYYIVHDSVWPIGSHDGMLCVECVEDRIGRRLRWRDFTQCYVNRDRFTARSDRLRTRMTRSSID